MATATIINRPVGVLTLDELAVLTMTSPDHIQPEKGETVIITTKDAYLWAVLCSELVSMGKDNGPEWFMSRFRSVLEDHRDLLRVQYGGITTGPRDNTALAIFEETAKKCEMDPEDMLKRAEAAYQSLLDKEMIRDPFKLKIATLVLAVLGLVPTGATSTTEKGGAFVKEVHAVTWSYTDKMDKDQKETRQVEIRLLKIIKIIQPKILEAYDELVMGDGGEEKTAKK
jgi:hypothetical protein